MKSSVFACLGVAMVAIVGCSESSSAPFTPTFAPPSPVFSNPTAITNTFLPFASLVQDVLEGEEDGAAIRVERTRMPGTRAFTIDGQLVQAMIIEDREFEDGELIEVTLDYFAQADDGTVYYLGEDVDIYEDGEIVGHEGAWLFGVDTQTLGVLMPGSPNVGDTFRSEDVPGITIEENEVISLSESVTVPAGTFQNCLRMREFIDGEEIEFKLYCPGVGVVKEDPPDGELLLISHN
jgi:hypothetical protein